MSLTVYAVPGGQFSPRVSQKTMKVKPAIALAAVFLGSAIWGPIAALVGTPLAAAVVSILDSCKKSYALAPEVAVVTGDGGPAVNERSDRIKRNDADNHREALGPTTRKRISAHERLTKSVITKYRWSTR